MKVFLKVFGDSSLSSVVGFNELVPVQHYINVK